MFDTVRWITGEGKILSSHKQSETLLPGKLRIIDQTCLPGKPVYLELDDITEIYDAILRLAVRGAPAIGCAAALGLAAAAQNVAAADSDGFAFSVKRLAEILAESRPTAVNLSWALKRSCSVLDTSLSVDDLKLALVKEGLAILAEDIAMCKAIGEQGEKLISEGMGVLTHCNAGALAAGDYGTALSPMYTAHNAKRKFTVYSCETRPLLQGSRLTAWELEKAGIDVVTICDSMAAQVMKEGKVDLILVGADRIAANGDTANKIGTYGLAVLAKHHNIPLYVAAPSSTIDSSLEHGGLIPIEQRGAEELRSFHQYPLAPETVSVYNPAFDVTPSEFISGIITEGGLQSPPFNFN